ncbi:acetyltransferase (GNAT) family protein [Ruminiclostridium sufflavum DSM 19573]|uniref:Acetyltransferase (GNAT) family protein n=1 Tax=Ruminiclostridium sufflavum DSM 19573 TaxID=1121337 RepID=A0A318XR37_9FIRM|nr:GNAT family N-acetyltransferase [Ruminiclostridium sufflavum]PYG88789.1 acetyltransferase (GNAT) family protein [Ruminiclostridium sufflavum DSM 19573]
MIRKIREEDKQFYLKMSKDFYSSDAVYRNIPEVFIMNTFDELMRSDNYLSGYIMEHENCTAGYALLARSFSQEAGGMVLWIDELYVMPQYRCCGLGHEFFSYLEGNLCYNVKRLRLEVEDSNEKAVSLYERMGFKNLPYSQMIKEL